MKDTFDKVKMDKDRKEEMRTALLNKKAKVNKLGIQIVAAATVIVIATPFIVNAATNGEFFGRIWGSLGKNDIDAHQELVYESEKDSWYYVDYPARDYDEIDPETAEALIGSCVEDLSIFQEIDGTTITLLSAVRDKNSAVVELSLEKEGGVDCLNYSQLDNESKGAWFSEDSTFVFRIGHSGNLFVDLDRSTDEKLYCYYYVTLNAFGASNLQMEIDQYPCTLGERDALVQQENGDKLIGTIENEKKTIYVDIPCEDCLESIEFANADGGVIEISSISMNIDMNTGLGLTPSEAYDPYNAYSICINFADGSSYTVLEHNCRDKHTCDVEIDNTYYTCGSVNNEYLLIFNRLVNTDNIVSITVNGVEYSR